ncbi:hypothetical protein RJ639_043701 [Escallonia herrerae]|uniref:Cyclin-dependent kinase inhibitor domain-containing protein n=1 Tax=Escallonia herrerae TaxID=1293975 RepID=A0AA89B0P3_9ASTE|nr:hypothetical protein RJ639_043701 [Escallonia herrerae]
MEVGVSKKATEVTKNSATTKKRKLDSEEQPLQPPSSDFQLVKEHCIVNSPHNSGSPLGTGASDQVASSFRSSNVSSLRSLNLKAEGSETLINGGFSRETTPSSEIGGSETDRIMESSLTTTTTKKKKALPASPRQKPSGSKMPSTTEIEDFFSAAEKYEQKRFADKYNYDVAKDVPLEGRYQWVRLKP